MIFIKLLIFLDLSKKYLKQRIQKIFHLFCNFKNWMVVYSWYNRRNRWGYTGED